jgi:hypothetical protein
MSRCQRYRLIIACLAGAGAAAAPACWPAAKIQGAPCPCPAGYSCCETLASCIGPEGSCPTSLPPSSNAACARDSDCAIGEICHSWSTDGGGLGGPQVCRRDCTAGFACTSPEVCSLVPHDGASLAELKVVRACTPLIPGCEQTRCQDCDANRLGKTYCQDKATHACFYSLHPVCGLSCTSQLIRDCGAAGCMDSGTGICNVTPSDPCLDFSCAACAQPPAPGQFSCGDAGHVVGCSVAQFPGATCDKLCKVISFECPEGSSCMAGAGALCTR